MAVYIKQITDGDDNVVYPQTHADAVFGSLGDNDGVVLQTIIDSLAPLNSPQFSGAPKVAAGSDYTTGKLRNIYFSTVAPSNNDGVNGDIWIVYS